MLVYQSSIARTYSTLGNNVFFRWDDTTSLGPSTGVINCSMDHTGASYSGHDPIPGPGKHLFVYIFGVGKSGRITMLVEPR